MLQVKYNYKAKNPKSQNKNKIRYYAKLHQHPNLTRNELMRRLKKWPEKWLILIGRISSY